MYIQHYQVFMLRLILHCSPCTMLGLRLKKTNKNFLVISSVDIIYRKSLVISRVDIKSKKSYQDKLNKDSIRSIGAYKEYTT